MAALLTVAEVADALRVSTMTVYRLIRTGELAAVRIGRTYRVSDSAFEDYLRRQAVQPEASSEG